jgi:hydroxypyruvate isomerase
MPIKQSLARWCFGKTELRELCTMAKRLGFDGIDLVEPREWPILRDHGLVCSLAPSHSIAKGLSDPANHADCERLIRDAIQESAAAGCPNVVCFSGNRGAIDDEQGIHHAAESLARVAPLAEKEGVTICLELLNSKDHTGYMADRTAWGVAVCERVGSPRVKLLYDIYHMQRMEGDLVHTIRAHARWIGHIHTAGVPGRHELDDEQEIAYPFVLSALKETGYKSWIGHEFLPRAEVLASLAHAHALVTRAFG